MTLQDILIAIDDLSAADLEQLRQHIEAKQQTPTERQTIGQRIPDLHPNAIVIRDDFFEPLPDEFWLGNT